MTRGRRDLCSDLLTYLLGDSIVDGARAESSPPFRFRSSQRVDVCQCPTRHECPTRQFRTPAGTPSFHLFILFIFSPPHGLRHCSHLWEGSCSSCRDTGNAWEPTPRRLAQLGSPVQIGRPRELNPGPLDSPTRTHPTELIGRQTELTGPLPRAPHRPDLATPTGLRPARARIILPTSASPKLGFRVPSWYPSFIFHFCSENRRT